MRFLSFYLKRLELPVDEMRAVNCVQVRYARRSEMQPASPLGDGTFLLLLGIPALSMKMQVKFFLPSEAF